jgi:DNA transformation protein
MRNLGPKSNRWLAEIGLHSIEDISALGAVETYARLRFRFGRQITRNMLHALAAALADIDWRQLSPEHKAELDRAAEERLARFNLTEI